MEKTGKSLKSLSILILVLWSLLSLNSLASIVVSATVDRNELVEGDTFQMDISVSSDGDMEAQEPRPPALDGLELVDKSVQTSISKKLVQGQHGMEFQSQKRHDYIFYFAVKKKGKITLDAFEVVADGKSYKTEPIVITVHPKGAGGVQNKKGSRNQRQGPGSGRPGFNPFDDMDRAEEELFNSLLQGRQRMLEQLPGQGLGNGQNGGIPEKKDSTINANEAFFIQVEVDKTEVYEGEQITVNWYLYTRGMLETLERLKFPDLKGFWKEIIEEVPAYRPVDEIVNGIPFKKALLASHALFPIKAGTVAIDEYKIRSRVRLPAQGYGTFGYGQPFEYTRSSKRIPITVKPLPVEGRPQNFSGAVGKYEVQASVESQSLPVNQPFSLKIRFEGSGNAKLIDLPTLQLPPTVETYDTKSDARFFKDGRSYKEFEVLMIPRQMGEVEIPALSIAIFDPKEKKYVTKSTLPLHLKIIDNPNAPGKGITDGNAKTDGSRPNDKKGENSRGVERGKGPYLPDLVLAYDESFWQEARTNSVGWMGVFGFIVCLLGFKARRELGWGRQERKFELKVAKKIDSIERAIKATDYRRFGVEYINLFYLVLGHLAGREAGSQELAKLIDNIPPSVRRDFEKDIHEVFEQLQTVGFAPEAMLGSLKTPEGLKQLSGRAHQLIQKLLAQSNRDGTAL